MQRRKKLRRDAEERRERVLAAAAELFQNEGYLVPLEKVAQKAGVTRPTIYRSFPDRGALAIAIFKGHLARLASLIEVCSSGREAFERLLLEIAAISAVYGPLGAAVQSDPAASDAVAALKAEFHAISERVLAAARAEEAIASTISVDDVEFLAQMIAGPSHYLPEDQKSASIRHALGKLMSGVSPRKP